MKIEWFLPWLKDICLAVHFHPCICLVEIEHHDKVCQNIPSHVQRNHIHGPGPGHGRELLHWPRQLSIQLKFQS